MQISRHFFVTAIATALTLVALSPNSDSAPISGSNASSANPNTTLRGKRAPNYDQFTQRSVAVSAPDAQGSAFAAIHQAPQDEYKGVLGSPSFLWNEPRPTVFSAVQQQQKINPQSVRNAALTILKKLAPKYHLSPAALSAVTVAQIHDTGRGAIIVQLQQYFAGMAVADQKFALILNRALSLVAASGFPAPNAPAQQNSANTTFSAPEAMVSAYRDITGINTRANTWIAAVPLEKTTQPSSFKKSGAVRTTPPQRFNFKPEWAGSAVPAGKPLRKLSWLPTARRTWYLEQDGTLHAAWNVEMSVSHANDRSMDASGYIFSAQDGTILQRRNLIHAASFNYRVWADANRVPLLGPQGDGFLPDPTGLPDGTEIVTGPATMVSIDHGPISTADDWLPVGATVTNGNNVHAYTDSDGTDGFNPGSGDHEAPTTSAATFDYSYDFTLDPASLTSLQNAAIVQAFYLTNYVHDWIYDAGFDEASGNGQNNNYGRGGLGNDAMNVEVQDSADRGNANMSSPSDGTPGTMQLFLWNGKVTAQVDINSPAVIAATFSEVAVAQFGPKNFDLTQDMVLVNDGVVDPTKTDSTVNDACEPIINTTELVGKIAVIDRGVCDFVAKIDAAQSAGAVGVVIVNQKPSGVSTMGDNGNGANINIPSVMLNNTDGSAVKTQLNAQQTVNSRIQRHSDVDLDVALDNGVVTHEWGHFLSSRLMNLTATQANGMGEGWSDFLALLLLTKSQDLTDIDGAFTAGNYVVRFPNAAYFGIRRQPYSTNMAINDMTFKHIQDGTPIGTAIPIAFGSDGSNNSEVHATGSVWAEMLWEAYVGMLKDNRYTFDQARNRMRDYNVAAMKAMASNPDFVEARDAYLAVAQASDASDRQTFLDAFAKRGLGIGAKAPIKSSPGQVGVTESFDNGQNIPTAVAGERQFVAENVTVTLDGSASSDPNGTVAAYHWTQITGPSVTLLTPDQAIATFTSPSVTSSTAFQFRLDVVNNTALAAHDSVIIVVEPAPPTPPPSSGGGGGGGSAGWLMLLLAGLGYHRRS